MGFGTGALRALLISSTSIFPGIYMKQRTEYDGKTTSVIQTTKETYENHGEGWYFRFEDNKMSYMNVIWTAKKSIGHYRGSTYILFSEWDCAHVHKAYCYRWWILVNSNHSKIPMPWIRVTLLFCSIHFGCHANWLMYIPDASIRNCHTVKSHTFYQH